MRPFHAFAATALLTMAASAAIGQTAAPTPAPPTAAPATGQTMAPSSSGASSTNFAGKWRASKLMGVDIYGPDNQKVGDVTEVIVDRAGRVESVAVGVGGFLGLGSKDVAVPFDQITWSDQAVGEDSAAGARGSPSTASAPATGTGSPASGAAQTAAPANRSATGAGSALMYPNHGKISLTKDQLQSAPAVTYSDG
jgi:sporulation protein YlmC with PRC-barrel domain